ncbi:flagellar filament capping protein FliD [Clostridium sp. D2Q-11]|uniref:Flagellar hook-associated protein 2 n=1 Tax=Anaeromonas frigoriresistens TaxID=2683708 RepID=A0A942UYW4_9FIRM|nr:flagellar filament capping protein FliD [Anaeromonas frigoriresistens]MBS4538137.1 flagellar filament capping protein FliD [Anaeromonas frigoriresistens]
MSDMLRITGMASGMDTEAMIEKLMKVERTRVDKVEQQKTYTEWKMEAYREIGNLLRGFQDEYFNVVKPSTNFRSTSAFSAFESSIKMNGIDTDAISINPSGSANPGNYTISNISLAKKAIWSTDNTKSLSNMVGTSLNMANLKQGKSFNINLDGVEKTITLDKDYAALTTNDLISDLQTKLDSAFGAGNIALSDNGGNIQIDSVGHNLQIKNAPHTYVSSLGFKNNQSNSILGAEIDFTNPVTFAGNIKVDINGTETEVAININATDITQFTSQLQSNIDTALGAGNIKVSNDGDKVKLISYDTSDKVTFKSGATDDVISKLGISNGAKITKLEGIPNIDISEIGKEFNINIDGTDYHIDLVSDFTDVSSLVTEINSQLTHGTINASVLDGKLTFIGTNGEEIKISNSTEGIVDDLGFIDGQKNTINLNDQLKDAKFAEGITFVGNEISFTINNESFTFNDTNTVKDVIDTVNSSNAGVNLTFNSVTDEFQLESKQTGLMNDITISDDSGNFLTGALGLVQDQSAQDANFTFNGVTTSRSSNEFTIDGVAYTLKAEEVGEINISINSNPDDTLDKIKEFVEKYNEVISKINGELGEKKHRDYKPLTDEQKKEMSEKDIELWDEKAKSGLLRSDSILQKITDEMRRSLYDKVEGVDISLYDIGIKTSSNYLDKGKLVINETKLRQALTDKPGDVIALFTKDSTVDYEDSVNRSDRYRTEGLSERLNDILKDNIRITRDANGRKGILLEKAGIEGDVTEFKNIMNEKINDYEDRIYNLLDDLASKENYYYTMFARMEKAISQMSAQSSWLMQQTGGGM